ncbi:MAG: hypothetical protein AAB400_01365 [Patescibacteria group bacterium]
MTLFHYILMMLAGTLLSWGAWFYVISTVNPFDTGMVGLLLFYVSLTFSMIGTFAIIGFFVRTWVFKKEIVFQRVHLSFRQAFSFALLVDGFLILQALRLLTWYNLAFLVVGLTLAEFFLISRRPTRYR